MPGNVVGRYPRTEGMDSGSRERGRAGSGWVVRESGSGRTPSPRTHATPPFTPIFFPRGYFQPHPKPPSPIQYPWHGAGEFSNFRFVSIFAPRPHAPVVSYSSPGWPPVRSATKVRSTLCYNERRRREDRNIGGKLGGILIFIISGHKITAGSFPDSFATRRSLGEADALPASSQSDGEAGVAEAAVSPAVMNG